MSNAERFEKAVTEASTEAMRIMREPRGGGAGNSNARRFDHQRSPVTRLSRPRHSVRRNLGPGNRRQRQTPHSRSGQSAAAITAMRTENLRCRAPARPRSRPWHGRSRDNDAQHRMDVVGRPRKALGAGKRAGARDRSPGRSCSAWLPGCRAA